MYFYKLKQSVVGNKKTNFLADSQVYSDPKIFFSGDNILYWGHRNDETNVIDMQNWVLTEDN